MTLVLALVVVFIPGLLAALILRLRGFTALALAAPLSFAMIAGASLVNVVVPFRWTATAWLITCIVFLALAVGIRVVVTRLIASGRISAPKRERVPWRREWVPFAVIAVVAVLQFLRLVDAFGSPHDISQTFDAIYHLNAVRDVEDRGFIAPTRQIIPGFYPALWHAITGTVVILSGAGVPATINVVSMVLAGLVWPIGCLWLVRTIVGRTVVATVTAGALSVGISAFPLLMLDFGVLYPNVLSISLLPSVIAALLWVSGLGRLDRPDTVTRWIILAALIPTLALAHPSTLMAFLMVAIYVSLTGFLRWRRAQREAGGRSRTRWVAAAALLVLLIVGAAAFWKLRPTPAQAFWPPSLSVPQAFEQIVSGAFAWRQPEWLVTILAAAGLIAIFAVRSWRRHWWLAASTLTLVFLYVVCVAGPHDKWRYLFSGTWYNDIYRIAALVPTFLVPLGALAVTGVTILLRRALKERARWLPATVGVAAGVAVLAVTQTGTSMSTETLATRHIYALEADSPLVSIDEMTLLERIDATVPADEVIVGSPWTGTSLSYAISDRRALIPHIYQELTPDMTAIIGHLRDAKTDPSVCSALKSTNTRWVLDFGPHEVHGGTHGFPGLVDLPADVARLVDQQGDAKLYEIIACR